MAANTLSLRLRFLKTWFDGVAFDGDASMTYEGVKDFSKNLAAAIVEAEALEDGKAFAGDVVRTFKPGLHVVAPAAPDNVVTFPRRPVRHIPVNDGSVA